MAKQADSNDPQIREAIARALMDDSPVKEAGHHGMAAAAAPNPKELFCKNWDTVRTVLLFLKSFLPKNLQGVVDAIIKAGDVLKGIIC
jgi:hypothetical protein